MVNFLKKISVIIKENRPVNEIVAVINQFEQYEGGFPQETTAIAGELLFEGRMESLLREKDANIVHLKDVIYSFQKTNSSQVSQGQDMTISVLKG